MMQQTLEHPNRKYLRKGVTSTMFCPGCACGQILNNFLYAVNELELDLNKVVTIGGVGCTARVPAYIDGISTEL